MIKSQSNSSISRAILAKLVPYRSRLTPKKVSKSVLIQMTALQVSLVGYDIMLGRTPLLLQSHDTCKALMHGRINYLLLQVEDTATSEGFWA